MLLPTGGGVLAALLLIGLPKRRRNTFLSLLMLAATLLLTVEGCGGSAGGERGNYLVKVVATSGSVSQATTFKFVATK
jgi:hypothetical protein